MNKLVEKFSIDHLPQSDDAIYKRERARKTASTVALSLAMLGTAGGVTHLGLNAVEHRAEVTQNINDDNVYKVSTLDKGNQSVDRTTQLPTLPSLEK